MAATETTSGLGSPQSALSHRTFASFGSSFAILDGAAVDGRPYEINQAAAGSILGDYRATLGLLQTQGTLFSPTLQYSGMKIETAEELFLDQDLIRGSKFEVFVPSRSKVEFYRDGRLLNVQVLDFGLREIDTTNFPQGSYDVDIVITDSFGASRRERKFFTKAGFLASRSQPIFSLEMGSIRDDSKQLDVPIYQASTRWRATDIFDLSGSVYGSDDLTVATLMSQGLYRELRFGLGVSESSQRDVGVSGNAGATLLGVNFSFDAAKTIRGGTSDEGIVPPEEDRPFDPIFDLPGRQRELIFQKRNANSGSVSKQVGDIDLRYTTEQSTDDGILGHYSRGPSIEWDLISTPITRWRLGVSDVQSERGKVTNAALQYTYRLNNNVIVSSQLSRLNREDGDETLLLSGISYDNKDRNEEGDRGRFTNDIRHKQNSSQATVSSITNQADLEVTNEYVRSAGFVRDVRGRGIENTGFGVNANTAFLVASDGSLSVSHPVSQDAVLVAEVASKSTQSPFEVLLDDQVIATIPANTSTVIGVTPYKTYDVKIRPVGGGDLVAYDSGKSNLTFFPGNVIKKKWAAEKVFIVVGRIINAAGQPLPRQRIKGTKEYTATEEDGTFQAEITGAETLTIDNNSNFCQLKFDITETPEYFLDLGDVACIQQK